MATPLRSARTSKHATRRPADVRDAERDARYENPFAPPDEGESADAARPRSLFGEILDWMLAPLLLLWPMSIAVTYLVAKTIANGPFDRALETDAYVLARQITPVNGVAELVLPKATLDLLRADNVDSVYYQVLGTRGELVAGEADLPLPRDDDRPPPGVVLFRDDLLRGNDIRVAYTTVALGGSSGSQPALVQVGETLDKRNALANDIIKGVILPQFVILPLAIVLVWFGLSRGLAPLTALQAHIRNRRPDDLSPVDPQRAPPEIEPLVTSFNDLLGRLEQNIALQKRFIADAAHQMKTPLAGLRTQAEFALRHEVPDEVARSLEQIATSSGQAARLVTQLLALARAENRASGLSFEPVDLAALARVTVRDWVQAAFARRMDLGYEGPDDQDVQALAPIIDGHAVMLREMLGNLIDNAIRYTPEGGRITVRLHVEPGVRLDATGAVVRAFDNAGAGLPGVAHIEVEDTGPGIPAHERGRVLERFYRILGRDGEGSGLGLAIVREIVTQHGGALAIDDHVYQDTPRLAGTLVRVSFALREAAPE
ncbi:MULTISPECIES: sensor histidine kinase [Burkholderia]|uniref:histidine kinase n=1 Tax=Burkholderia gladioli TaxID=28095 RepID=A0A2A7S0M6_BURGA|nr:MULTISPECIES: sensor histidine kinase [Burkholderia]ATF86469.1 sensor histidine kinase [Burkholderia gladioli pv. gladioli]MBJ9662838.1 sensor histidine kinase N-terminal domain-containing protein [Burkholderia gladioli]MBJ9714624.1 sensor histidine kinase N-terminal domain-containing protein [Burkholderia gladioli]MBU9158647.1 sensor histidine kinase N-terminal domain-containing protein [Burkholderia gladioli]MBU9199292.1 sensor histidine kinase N-terminal domain-containing protein [Burkho